MFGHFVAGSLTTLTFSLSIAIAPLFAEAVRDTLGVYDDWSVHLRQDDAIRVCYVETKLVSSQEVANGPGDVRIQVTDRSFSASSDMIRFAPESEFSGIDNEVVIDSTLDIRVTSFTQLGFNHTRVVNHMKAGEAAKGEMVLRTISDSTSHGVFSLSGFTAAYNSIGRFCPEARETFASSQPISVSDISVKEGPTLHSEFSVTGPFFQTQEADRIKIRAVPSQFAEIDAYTVKENFRPSGIFTYGSQRLEFYHNEALIDSLQGGSQTNRIEGACLDSEFGRLKIVMHSWDGGASDPGRTSVVYFDTNGRIVEEIVAWIDLTTPIFRCSENESPWQWGGRFLPCQCIGRADKDAYSVSMDEVVREMGRFDPDMFGAETRIDEGIFSSLLSRISRIKPFTQWDAGSSIDAQHFESSKFEVAWIKYTDHADVYGCEQYTYVRRRTDDFWVPVYSAQVSSKGFNAMRIHGFVDDENLDIDICVKFCNSWGNYERLTRNVADWQQVVLNCKGWYDEDFFKFASLEEVQNCLDAGIDANTRYSAGVTPLHRAAGDCGDPAIISTLINAGADKEAQDDEEWTPLHRAAVNHEPQILSVLLKSGVDLEAKGLNATTVLHLAAESNSNPVVIMQLITAGADVNGRTENGYTPLHTAGFGNSVLEVFKVLLDAGADPNARTASGWTPLHSAAEGARDVKVFELLVNAGADPNARTVDGWTPLHSVARSVRDVKVIKVLLNAGADPNARNKDGETPMHVVVRHARDPDVIEEWIASGADLNARNMRGYTPLHLAVVSWEHFDQVKVLVEKGADLEVRDQDGNTPLHLAACCNVNSKFVKVLLDAGADVDARGQFESTPLHVAALQSKNAGVVKALIDAGANLAARNKGGRTPLDLAVERNDDSKISRVLRDAGAIGTKAETKMQIKQE